MQQFVPWRQIANWRCTACGDCCKYYGVVLKFPEYLSIIRNFGPEKAVAGVERLYIKRRDDGTCSFLCHFLDNYVCGLQSMKPDACKIWPFKIFLEARFGEPDQAVFEYHERKLYVYADSNCPGLKLGLPTWEFAFQTLREFIDLAIGSQRVQHRTTGKLSQY